MSLPISSFVVFPFRNPILINMFQVGYCILSIPVEQIYQGGPMFRYHWRKANLNLKQNSNVSTALKLLLRIFFFIVLYSNLLTRLGDFFFWILREVLRFSSLPPFMAQTIMCITKLRGSLWEQMRIRWRRFLIVNSQRGEKRE